jgi:hypothetical protein
VAVVGQVQQEVHIVALGEEDDVLVGKLRIVLDQRAAHTVLGLQRQAVGLDIIAEHALPRVVGHQPIGGVQEILDVERQRRHAPAPAVAAFVEAAVSRVQVIQRPAVHAAVAFARTVLVVIAVMDAIEHPQEAVGVEAARIVAQHLVTLLDLHTLIGRREKQLVEDNIRVALKADLALADIQVEPVLGADGLFQFSFAKKLHTVGADAETAHHALHAGDTARIRSSPLGDVEVLGMERSHCCTPLMESACFFYTARGDTFDG